MNMGKSTTTQNNMSKSSECNIEQQKQDKNTMWLHLFQVEKRVKLNSDILFGDVHIGDHLWGYDGLNVCVPSNSHWNSNLQCNGI